MHTHTAAVIYLRISQDREGLELGVDRQEREARAMAERLGLTITDVYVDNDRGASTRSKKSRPAYERLIRDVELGRVRTVLAYSLSRLTRRPSQGEAIITLAESRGLQIRTVASGDPDLTRADGRAVFRTIMAWDAAEAERISERVALATRQRAEMGRFHGGSRRFGYSQDCSELIPGEAALIADAYRRVIAGGSLRSIAADWKAAGIVGPQGAVMAPNTLRDILLRPLNAGLATYRGEIVGPSNAPAIVDEDTYKECREILTDPARRVTTGRPARGLLSGILLCGVCGSLCYTRNRNGRPVYTCHKSGHVTRVRDPLDAMVTDLVMAFAEANRGELSKPVAADSGASQELGKLRDRMERLHRLADTMEPEDYAAAVAPLRARLRQAEADAALDARRPASAALVASEDIPAAWEALSLDERRTVVRELLASLTMHAAGRGAAFDPATIGHVWADLSG